MLLSHEVINESCAGALQDSLQQGKRQQGDLPQQPDSASKVRRLGAANPHPTHATTTSTVATTSRTTAVAASSSPSTPFRTPPPASSLATLTTATCSTTATFSMSNLPPVAPVATAGAAAVVVTAGQAHIASTAQSPSATTASPAGSVGDFAAAVMHDTDDAGLRHTSPGGTMLRVCADDVLAPPAFAAINVSASSGGVRDGAAGEQQVFVPPTMTNTNDVSSADVGDGGSSGDGAEVATEVVAAGARMLTPWMPGDSFKRPTPSAGVGLIIINSVVLFAPISRMIVEFVRLCLNFVFRLLPGVYKAKSLIVCTALQSL